MSLPTRITFSHIIDVIKSMGNYNKPVLGRWKLYDEKNIPSIIKHANEDHCGPCGVNNIVTTNEITNTNETKKIIKKYNYTTNKNVINEDNLLDIEYSYMSINNPNKSKSKSKSSMMENK